MRKLFISFAALWTVIGFILCCYLYHKDGVPNTTANAIYFFVGVSLTVVAARMLIVQDRQNNKAKQEIRVLNPEDL